MGHKKKKHTKKKIDKFTGQELKVNSRHHIIPSSRNGSSDSYNIAMIDDHKHQLYHHIFINMTPTEIIEYLADYFWNGNWSFVEEALQNHCLEEVGYDL
ncbi:hypothetical protein [Desulfonauticus submarinus]